MFTYNFRIFDRFDRPAMSLAILCDSNREWRPTNYSYNYPNTRLSFEFGSVKLLDYENRFHELENLGEALLDFTTLEDLLNWLQTNQSA